ncbi:MAG: glutamate-5-semialdehyde dehydrogenase [Planctomycetota bacterium]|jgi:glutamate-5-semialdehyde dehydrogenase
MNAKQYVEDLATAARAAAAELAVSPGHRRDAALLASAESIRSRAAELAEANARDLAAGKKAGLSEALLDRLALTDERTEGLACALEAIAAQTDPVGRTVSACNRPNGLRIEKRRVPLGVVAIIYESRPNVTADAGGLCLKSGNACILRGGKEAIHSNLAIAACLQEGLGRAGLPAAAVTMVDSTDRTVVPALAQAEGLIDLIVPRGGEGLIRAVVKAATIPVIKHYAGNCHVYVDARCNPRMARDIVLNAKCQRPGVCNAAETLLVHADHAAEGGLLGQIIGDLLAEGVELRGDERARAASDKVAPACDDDWRAEYLAPILAVRVVESLAEAIDHINAYGSKHTDAIVTDSVAAANAFTAAVDSSSVMVNASTRFSDGGEYGLGAEVGISTDKLHARGPMGADDLTTYKWIVTGDGHLRR